MKLHNEAKITIKYKTKSDFMLNFFFNFPQYLRKIQIKSD